MDDQLSSETRALFFNYNIGMHELPLLVNAVNVLEFRTLFFLFSNKMFVFRADTHKCLSE